MRLCLFEPEIAGNVGAIMRLGACMGIGIDLIEPMGFDWDDKRVRRTAMDYIDHVAVQRHPSFDAGDTTYGGRWVVNPSGGLISKGHPLGATGLAQCAELTWQLRGDAGKRQVPDVRAALQHNIGLGGAAVVTAYQRA